MTKKNLFMLQDEAHVTIGDQSRAPGVLSGQSLTSVGTRQGTWGKTSPTAGFVLIVAVGVKPGGRALDEMGTDACMNLVCFACRRS